jgi:hypothetical protein
MTDGVAGIAKESQALARSIAASVVEGAQGAANANTPQGTDPDASPGGPDAIDQGQPPAVSTDDGLGGGEGLDAQGAENLVDGAVTPDQPPADPEPQLADFADLEASLAEQGVSLPDVSAIPADLRGAYREVLASINEAMLPISQRDQEAALAIEEVETFKERLEKDPGNILVTLALTNPDVFKQATETFERMQEDEAFKDLVVREITASSRLARAEATERNQLLSSRREKGRQATVLTRQAAARHGVDSAVAERYIASQVTAGGGDLDLNAIDSLVAELKGTAPRALPTPPRAVSPDAVQRAAAAPTQPVEGAQPAGTSPGLTPDPPAPKRGGKFRELVRVAARKTRLAE